MIAQVDAPHVAVRRFWTWESLLRWAAVGTGVLLLVIGAGHLDKEALVLGALFLGLAELARRRPAHRSVLVPVLVGLLFLNIDFWMLTATVSNVRSHESLTAVIESSALAAVSLAGIASTIGSILTRHDPARARRAPSVTALVAVAAFLLTVVSATLLGIGPPAAAAGDLTLSIRNTAYSTTSLEARSGQVTLYVTNNDLFWHTVTIDRLGVDLQIPVGGHRRISFTAPAGTYAYYCRIPGHYQAGMHGTITVP